MLLYRNDVIELSEKSQSSAKLNTALENNNIREIPAWIDVEKSNQKATIKDFPKREDITSTIEERLIVELYSK